MRRTRGAIATGLLLAAAFLTKQNGLAEGVAVLTALTFGPRRRLVWPAALTYGAVLGISTLMLGLTSRGWYVYYVFVLMTEHTLKYAAFAQFWTVYLLPMLGLAGCALILGLRRTPLVLVAGCGALMVESYAALVHSGGRVNDLLPAYLAVALLAGLALGAQPGGLVSFYADRIARVRVASWQAGQIGPWVAAAAAALVITQMAVLVSGFRPGQTIPTSADRAVGLRLTSGMRALGGTIAVPSDPGLSLLAGLPGIAHQGATDDVLRASNPAASAGFRRSAARAAEARQFRAIVTENTGPPSGFPADLMRYYRRCPQMLLPGVPAALFQPVAGPPGRPAYLWLPVGAGSCAAAVRTFDGSAAATLTVLHQRPGRSGRRQLPGESAGGIRRSICMALAGGDGRAIPAVRRRVRSAATPHVAGRRAAETPGARSAPGPAP